MSMSKKDYVAVAAAAAAVKAACAAEGSQPLFRAGCDSAREFIARRLVEAFAADNPRFDRYKFLDACGVA